MRGLRFAFYGRTSTADYQDRFSSHGWQREVADELIADHGTLLAEFFDVGCPRRLPWSRRPQASTLLAALPGGEAARFDAIVVGEYERAFAPVSSSSRSRACSSGTAFSCGCPRRVVASISAARLLKR
jgi:site-specific DNA recombinase